MKEGYAGRKDEAQKQYAIAAGLDLSADDKAELAKVRGLTHDRRHRHSASGTSDDKALCGQC